VSFMTTPSTRLKALADPSYQIQVEAIIESAKRITSDAELSFIDLDDIVGSWAQFCLRDHISKIGQLNLVSELLQLVWWCALPITEDNYRNLIVIVRRALNEIVMSPVRARPDTKKGRRRHLILCAALQSPLHSPSLGAIDYARALADSDREAEISFLLLDYSIDPALKRYSDSVFSQLKKKPDFRNLNEQNTITDILLSSEIIVAHIFGANALDFRITSFAKTYPTIMFTCGDLPPFQYADVYWHQQADDYVKSFWKRCGVPDLYINNYSGGAPCTSAPEEPVVAKCSKAEAGFSEDQVVMVSVGNRLSVDMTDEFLAGMLQLLVYDKNLVWMIVGGCEPAIVDTLIQALGNQIIHIPYEPELQTLLTLTDIFVNPFRKGGGGSALTAMRAGSIVLTRTDFGDVASLAPHENGADTAEGFFERLNSLITSPALREEFLERQNARLSQLTDQTALSRAIAGYVALAQKRFKRRKSQGIDFLADA
jgi:Glycosyl transferases group 1